MDNTELDARVDAELSKYPVHDRNDTLKLLIRLRLQKEDEDAVAITAEHTGIPEVPALSDFNAMHFPEQNPLLGPFSSQQLTFVFAPTGAGKSMFALGLAYAMAEGQSFCGWHSQGPRRVLFVDGEMVAANLQQRMRGLQSERLFIANIATWAVGEGLEPPNLAEESGQAMVHAWILKHDIDVVVLDNLMSLAWQDGVSMNSDESWQPVRRWCVAERAEGRSVVIVDHSNQAGNIFGSKTKLWHVDMAIKLEEIESEPEDEIASFDLKTERPVRRFAMSFQKQRGTTDREPDVVVTAGDIASHWTVEMAADVKRKMAKDMRENGLTIRDIAEELSAPKSTVHRWVKGVVPLPGV